MAMWYLLWPFGTYIFWSFGVGILWPFGEGILWPFGVCILWPFGNLVSIWYISIRFGILCQEKIWQPCFGRP
jgi:hypothetical protein